MKLRKMKRAAYVSAAFAVLGSVPAYAGGNCLVGVNAANGIDAQVPYTMNICANVQNNFTVAQTDPDFANIGATGWANESGCLTMHPDGTMDESQANCWGKYGAPTNARIVSADDTAANGYAAGNGTGATAGDLAITGAFPDQEIRMWFQVQNTTNKMAPSGGNGPSLWYTQLVADTGANGTTTQKGEWDIAAADAPEAPASLVALDTAAQADVLVAGTGGTYKGLTDAATGDLDITIGATIQTDGTFAYDPLGGANGHYYTDEFNGTFEVVLFY